MNYDELYELLGQEAFALIQQVGGATIYIPNRKPFAIKDVSSAAIEKLVKYAGGCIVYIPKMDTYVRNRRNQEIKKLYNNGVSMQVIARQYKLTVRHISNIIR